MPATMPAQSDVATRLSEMGVTAPSTASQDAALAAAIDLWETLTGYAPFLADEEESTWQFTPNGTNLIDFEGGFVSVESISTGNFYQATATEAVERRDYILKPNNAPLRGKPYTYALFNGVLYADTVPSVEVTGIRGYSETVPDDAWLAILEEATARLLPAAQSLSAGGSGAEKVKQDGVEYSYGDGSTSTVTQAGRGYSQGFYAAAMRYRRIQVR